VPPPPGYSCEQMEGVGNTRCVPQFQVQSQTLLAERLRPIKIVQAHIESRGSNERFCAHSCCHPIAQRQRSLQKIPPPRCSNFAYTRIALALLPGARLSPWSSHP